MVDIDDDVAGWDAIDAALKQLYPGVEPTHGDGLLEVQTPAAVLQELAQVLRPVAGTYQLASAPDLAIQITKSQIRDQDGEIVEEIG